eukprot:g14273.t1
MLNRHLAPLTVNIVPKFLAQYMKQQYQKYVHLFKETMKSVWRRTITGKSPWAHAMCAWAGIKNNVGKWYLQMKASKSFWAHRVGVALHEKADEWEQSNGKQFGALPAGEADPDNIVYKQLRAASFAEVNATSTSFLEEHRQRWLQHLWEQGKSMLKNVSAKTARFVAKQLGVPKKPEQVSQLDKCGILAGLRNNARANDQIMPVTSWLGLDTKEATTCGVKIADVAEKQAKPGLSYTQLFITRILGLNKQGPHQVFHP